MTTAIGQSVANKTCERNESSIPQQEAGRRVKRFRDKTELRAFDTARNGSGQDTPVAQEIVPTICAVAKKIFKRAGFVSTIHHDGE